ncbi:MAG: sigma factor [Streptosporangiaceae bacterium]
MLGYRQRGVRDDGQVPAPGSTDGAEVSTADLAGLLGRVAAGDAAAFAGIYDELAPVVFGLCLRILHDPAHAADATQEALVEVWRSAPRYRADRGSVRAWMLAIAYHRAIDRVRTPGGT